MGAGDGVMSTMAGYKDIKMTPVPESVAKALRPTRLPEGKKQPV